MSILKRLFGAKAGATKGALATRVSNLTAPTLGKPTYVDAVAGQIATDFYAHEECAGIAGNFLTGVTEGLAATRQRELALTLRLGVSEDPLPKMKDILRLVTTVRAWAHEGNLVDEGGFTQFGERGLFGRPQSGLLYTDARPMAGVKLPERALAAVFVDAQEIRAALDFGTYRVLTRIGLQLRLFPFPTWGDLDRPSAMTPREGESQLTKVARLRAHGVSYVMSAQRLRVTIPSDPAIMMTLMKGLVALPQGVPFVLLTRPAMSANAILVWTPGQEGMAGISPDGSDSSRLSGSCLLIVPNGQSDQIRQLEDGYSVCFCTDSWELLSAALAAQRPLSLPMADGLHFEIEWLPSEG